MSQERRGGRRKRTEDLLNELNDKIDALTNNLNNAALFFSSAINTINERLSSLEQSISRLMTEIQATYALLQIEDPYQVYTEALNHLTEVNLRYSVIPVEMFIPRAVFEHLLKYRPELEPLLPLSSIQIDGFVYIFRLDARKAMFYIWLIKINKAIVDGVEQTKENTERLDKTFMGMALRVRGRAFHPLQRTPKGYYIPGELIDTSYDPMYSWGFGRVDDIRRMFNL